MDNTYFVFSDTPVHIERFHICIWEFTNDTALVEFGLEIDSKSLQNFKFLSLNLYAPWITNTLGVQDLYKNLKDSRNSKFIFNDSVTNTGSLDGGSNTKGVIHNFSRRAPLAVLPAKFKCAENRGVLNIILDLSLYNEIIANDKPNVYIRFYLEPSLVEISTRNHGISRSTIIYDIKVHESRNIPDNIRESSLCEIENCFCFNIIPNSYDFGFYESAALKNVRNLEYLSFKHYLPDKRLKDKELVVVFNKKKKSDGFNFFSIFSRERIGTGQFALAFLVNLICGILLAFPAYRSTLGAGGVGALPFEFWLALLIGLSTVLYFVKKLLS